jgi:hypothetical protein
MRRIADSLFVPVLLAVLVIVFLWPVILPPAGQVAGTPSTQGSDIVAQFYPWSRIFVEGLRRGHLVLWNPYSFLGKPFQADPQPAELYPVTWLFAVMDAGAAFGVALAFHLWLMAFGMYALARTFGVSKPGALLSGITFAFSGFVTSKIFVGFHDVFATMAWLPWAMAALRWAWSGRRVGWAALAGLPIALGGLTGSPAFYQYTLVAVAALGLYLIARSWRESGRREALRATALVALALACGLLIAAVQLLPTLELTQASTRAGSETYEFASDRPFPITHLLMLLAPDIFGPPVGSGKYWGADWYHELQIYLGIAPLVLALVAMARGDRQKWFFIGLGGTALVYALGPEGYLHMLVYRFAPGIGLVRLPSRANVLFMLSASVLAGLGWDVWTADAERDRAQSLPGQRWFAPIGAVAVAAGLLAFVEASVRASDATANARLMQVASQSLRFAVLLGISYVVLRWRWRGGTQSAFIVATLALTLLDLWSVGGKFTFTQPLGPNSSWWPLADRVMAKDRSEFRVLEYTYSIMPGTNDNILFHLQSLNGYDPLMPRDSVELTEINYGLEGKLLDMLAVRYIVIREETTIDATGFRQLAHEGNIIVYERPNPQGRAFMVHQVQVAPHDQVLARLVAPTFDPRAAAVVESPPGCPLAGGPGADTVTLVRDDLDQVIFQAHAASDGLLIMSDTFYPGWRAQVDGKTVPIVRANYALRGICLPAGDHQVVFRFEPTTLRVGALLAGIGLLSVAITLVVEGTWKRHETRR